MSLTNEKILKMLNSGETDELKSLLENEIYIKALNKETGVDKRYKAMINYFKLSVSLNSALPISLQKKD